MSDDDERGCLYNLSRILVWLAGTTLSIATLIVGFGSTCDNHSTVIDPNTFLKVAGFIGIIDALCVQYLNGHLMYNQ